jgi:hypothetical protein
VVTTRGLDKRERERENPPSLWPWAVEKEKEGETGFESGKKV